MSLPVRGAWVEISFAQKSLQKIQKSLPVRGAWVEIGRNSNQNGDGFLSLPVRGAWVEMSGVHHVIPVLYVAPRAGSVG